VNSRSVFRLAAAAALSSIGCSTVLAQDVFELQFEQRGPGGYVQGMVCSEYGCAILHPIERAPRGGKPGEVTVARPGRPPPQDISPLKPQQRAVQRPVTRGRPASAPPSVAQQQSAAAASRGPFRFEVAFPAVLADRRGSPDWLKIFLTSPGPQCKIVAQLPISGRLQVDCPSQPASVTLGMPGFRNVTLRSDDIPESRIVEIAARSMPMSRSVRFRTDAGQVSVPRLIEDWDLLTPEQSPRLLKGEPVLSGCRVAELPPLSSSAPDVLDVRLDCSPPPPGQAVADVQTPPRADTAGPLVIAPPVRTAFPAGSVFQPLDYDPAQERVDEVRQKLRFARTAGSPPLLDVPLFGRKVSLEPALKFVSARGECPVELRGQLGGKGPADARCDGPWTGLKVTYRPRPQDRALVERFLITPVETPTVDVPIDTLPSAEVGYRQFNIRVEQAGDQPLPAGLWLRLSQRETCASEDVTRSGLQKGDVELKLAPNGIVELGSEGRQKEYLSQVALLHDKQTPLTPCVPLTWQDNAGPPRFVFKLNRAPAARQLLIVSPSQAFVDLNYAGAFKDEMETLLRRLRDRKLGQGLQLVELTEDRSVVNILNGAQLAHLADMGNENSLLSIKQRLRFTGSPRRALDDLNLVTQSLRGVNIDKIVYVVDSTQEQFQSSDAGAVYEWTLKSNVELTVVSIGNCRRWREFKGVQCRELPDFPDKQIDPAGIFRQAFQGLEAQ
jgi:hypothetical protein